MAVSVLTSVTNDTQTGMFKGVITAASSSGASSICLGFKPRKITIQQIGGTPGASWFSQWVEGMTAAYQINVTNAGTGTIATANGITVFDGTGTDRTDVMTGSPVSTGPGFVVGTACVANSLVYYVTAER